MGTLLVGIAVLAAVVLFLSSRMRMLTAYVDRERRAVPHAPRVARFQARHMPARHRPRPLRTGRLAKLGYRHHRERADGAFI